MATIINFEEGCTKLGRHPRKSYIAMRARAFEMLDNTRALLDVINRIRFEQGLKPQTLADITKRDR